MHEPLDVRYPEPGQLDKHCLFKSTVLLMQDAHEKAPPEQVAQGDTHKVHVP